MLYHVIDIIKNSKKLKCLNVNRPIQHTNEYILKFFK